jgi:4-amino-4-deoxy-L-arabinose transferase-like glycosyltransferase
VQSDVGSPGPRDGRPQVRASTGGGTPTSADFRPSNALPGSNSVHDRAKVRLHSGRGSVSLSNRRSSKQAASSRAEAALAANSPPPAPSLEAAEVRGFPAPRLADLLGIAALTCSWLAIAIGYHPIGDHYTESDFYGAYASGAREILDGRIDPTRYGIYGPVYEWVLALGAAAGLELFLAAKLVAVASAGAALAAWWCIVAAALGRGAARWAVALIALTPVFTRYAYSATTDMLAAALGSWALALLVTRGGRIAPASAGLLAALAVLTRYQALVLLPIGVIVLALGRAAAPPSARGRQGVARAAATFALTFVLGLAPWCAFSVGKGFVPGQTLATTYGFYAAEDGSQRNIQDHLSAAPSPAASAPGAATGTRAEEEAAAPPEAAAPENRTLSGLVRERPAELAERWRRRLAQHAGDDARVMLGTPFALAALAGALLWMARPLGPYRGALAAAGLLLYLGLVPAFYSDRYRLMLVPLYAAAAAALWPALARHGRPGRIVALLALLAVLGPLLARNVGVQREIHRELPRDVLALAPALAALDEPGTVMSRKGHIGYYARRTVAAFPRVPDVAALGDAAHKAEARFLYYSWYEAQMRPEFLCLLDTTRVLPGLERVAVRAMPPAVLYRVGPGFGEPGWYADSRERAVSEARAAIWALSDSAGARGLAVLAADAYLRGEMERARRFARGSLEVLPDEKLAARIDSLARSHAEANGAAPAEN